MNTVLLSAYWPSLQYFYYVLNSEKVLIEQHEHYQKQSFRNRTQILTANGVLDLAIPVLNTGNKTTMQMVEIEYKERWQMKHWRAITSAYKNSPYFDFFEEEILAFYNEEEKYLLRYNLKQLELIFKILRKKKNYALSETFEEVHFDSIDKRFDIHPKINFENDLNVKLILQKKYYQTFSDKHAFTPNLSVLDLIFNEGKGALNYLINA